MGYYNEVTEEWVVDGKTDGGQIYAKVRADLFKPGGKWQYKVFLDYSDIWHRIVSSREREKWIADHSGEVPEYLDPAEAAWMALGAATVADRSGVTISGPECGYVLVVLDPPNGYPIMAHPAQGT